MHNDDFPHLKHVSLGALRAVETVARLGSVRAAAEMLGVTPGAVSQQVIKAEAQLNRTLFDRSSVGLTPTQFGTEVIVLLRNGFRKLDQGVALSKTSGNTLTVSVAPVFAARWLVPRLPELEAQSDNLRINVDATADYVEPGASGIDACLRVASKSNMSALKSDLSATWLADQYVFPVCAPKLAERLHTPADLLTVPIITDSKTTLDWQVWLDQVGLANVQLRNGSSYSDASLCIDAAISGGGVFLAWDMLAVDAVARGDLVKPFKHVATSTLSYWLGQQKRPAHPKRMRQLENWLNSMISLSLLSNEVGS